MSVSQPVSLLRPLVLGSASPRRSQILRELGLPFEVRPSDAPEPAFEGGAPAAYAADLASRKAAAVLHLSQDGSEVILAADTIVVVDDQVLGKPEGDRDAIAMLERLVGRTHSVITAIEVRMADATPLRHWEETKVWFRALSASALTRYIATGEGRDKAGSYAIQGLGAGLVERIEGSYSNVVGLPAAQTLTLLQKAGVLTVWP